MGPAPHLSPSAPEDRRRPNGGYPEDLYSANPDFDNTPWPADADANHFHAVMSKVDLRSFGPAGELPPPTCREVVCNAMASVRFLDDLGEDIIMKRSLGIDRYGRLCKVGRSDLDFRDIFCQFVAGIRWKLRHEMRQRAPAHFVRERIEAYISDLRSYGEPDVHSPEKLPSLGVRSDNSGAVRRLYDEAQICLSAPDFGIQNIQALHARCRPAAAELEDLITLAEGVAQDLAEKGSSDSCDAMLEMRRSVGLASNSMERMFEEQALLWRSVRRSPAMEKMLEQDIHRARTVISGDETVHTLLSYTIHLKNELEAAIHGFPRLGST